MAEHEPETKQQHITEHDVRHVAKLARLRPTDGQVASLQHDMAAVLGHIAMLNELDLQDVEPMTSPADPVNRWCEDEPATPLDHDELQRIAPETDSSFIKVPKVLGEGGGA